MKKYSTEEILLLTQKNKNAFNQFYLDSIDIFFRYIKANYFIPDNEAQDILSDFYLRIRNNLSFYQEKNNFSAWIWTIFKNLLKDYFKKSRELAFSQIKETDEYNKFEDNLQSDDDIREIMEKNFNLEKIKSAMDKLDNIYQDIIFFKFIEEKSNLEIAKIVGISEDNVRKRLSRGIQKLKELLINK